MKTYSYKKRSLVKKDLVENLHFKPFSTRECFLICECNFFIQKYITRVFNIKNNEDSTSKKICQLVTSVLDFSPKKSTSSSSALSSLSAMLSAEEFPSLSPIGSLASEESQSLYASQKKKTY